LLVEDLSFPLRFNSSHIVNPSPAIKCAVFYAFVEGQWLADRSNDNTPVLAVVTGFGHVEEMKGGKNRENQNILEPSNVLKQGLIKLRSNN